jgi:hypothetical protein
MVGYVTSSRQLEIEPALHYWHRAGSGAVRNERGLYYSLFGRSVIPVATQTTTSYRTGARSEGGVSLEDVANEVATPSTEAGVVGYLKTIEEINPSAPSYDTGHTFSTIRSWIEDVSHPHVHAFNGLSGLNSIEYEGAILPDSGLAASSRFWIVPNTFNQVSTYGPQAIALTAPTNPASTVGQAIGELFIDGLPKIGLGLFHTGEHFMRKLAQGHLSVQFDWLPFISDLRSAVHAMLNASRIMRQYERDSGRIVRRRWHFDPIIQNTNTITGLSARIVNPMANNPTTFQGGTTPPQNVVFWGSGFDGARTVDTVSTKTELWFKGAYSYFLPKDPSFQGRMLEFEAKANHLLGLELTPNLLWQLAPWSWLIDWKSQVGSSIKNFTAFSTDGLVIRWGYLMATTTTRHTITCDGLRMAFGSNANAAKIISPSVTYVVQRKERFRATPYGFGISTSAFTAKQWSILAALGMTRSPKTLRSD